MCIEGDVERMTKSRISDGVILHEHVAKCVLPLLVPGAVEADDLAEVLECIGDIQVAVGAKGDAAKFTEFDVRWKA